MIIVLALMAAVADEPRLASAIYQAIQDEIGFGLDATRDQNINRYMETVPDDYRISEDDGRITDKAALRAKQLQAWSIIKRTNAIKQDITAFKLGCEGRCATVWTSQLWDREMLGRDGKSVHNVVTTQDHEERWELRGSRWTNVTIKELGGKVFVDGKPF